MPPPNSTDSKTPAGRSTVPSSGIRRNSTPPCRVQSHQILPARRERWRVSLRFLGQLLELALCAVEWARIHFYGIKDPAPSEAKRPWAFLRSEGSPEVRGSAAEMNSGPLNRLKRHHHNRSKNAGTTTDAGPCTCSSKADPVGSRFNSTVRAPAALAVW